MTPSGESSYKRLAAGQRLPNARRAPHSTQSACYRCTGAHVTLAVDWQTETRRAQVYTGTFRGRKSVAGAAAAADAGGACASTAARQKRAGRAPKPSAKATACAAAAVRGLRLAPGALPGQRGPDVAAPRAPSPPLDARQQAFMQRQDQGEARHAPSTATAAAGPAAPQAPACRQARLPAALCACHASGSQPQTVQASCGLRETGRHAAQGSPVAAPALSDVTLSQTPPKAPATGAAAPAVYSGAESRPPAVAIPCCATPPPMQPSQQCAAGPHIARSYLTLVGRSLQLHSSILARNLHPPAARLKF